MISSCSGPARRSSRHEAPRASRSRSRSLHRRILIRAIAAAGVLALAAAATTVAAIRLDRGFSSDGIASIPFGAGDTQSITTDVAVDQQGRTIVVGSDFATHAGGETKQAVVARLTRDGRLDSTFSGDGVFVLGDGEGDAQAVAIAVQSDGRIVVATDTNGALDLLRLNDDGSLDPTFGTAGFESSSGLGEPQDMVIGDGRIFVAGNTTSHRRSAVAAFSAASGSPDGGFGTDGVAELGYPHRTDLALALQGANPIVASIQKEADNASVSRLTPSGTIDASFGDNGAATTTFGAPSGRFGFVARRPGPGVAIAVEGNGKIVVGDGVILRHPTASPYAIARFQPNGSADRSFSGDGARLVVLRKHFSFATYAADLLLLPRGKVVQVGDAAVNGSIAFVQYLKNGRLDPSFDGNGIASIPVGVKSFEPAASALGPGERVVTAGDQLGRRPLPDSIVARLAQP